ncbi:MAG: LL-diaminopimelate aminotransferase [Alicyclobacillus sp.]|nr:LL-diaminopimelate aminotransferase [Alicyclobacillus sp.]
MQIAPSDKLRQLPTSVFAEVARRRAAAQARGVDVIDLSIGSPDLPPAPAVRDALAQAVADPAQYGYALSGTAAFHQAVADFYRRRYGVALQPHREVLQVAGSQDALAHLAMALVNPGEVVLAPDPGYPIYHSSVQIAGADLFLMPIRPEYGNLPRFDIIPQEIAARAKLMILNHPGNPVPSMATRGFFEQAISFARQHGIVVVHDFAYSELVYDGRRPVSFLSIPGANEVGIELNSLSKTFNLAGARIGYAVGNEQVLSALATLKSHIDYGVFLPIQHAACVALQTDDHSLAAQAEVYQARRDALTDALQSVGWNVDRPPATMFVWARIPAGWTSQAFAIHLIEEAGVVVTPGDAFGREGEGYVRIALVQPEARLREAARRIGRALQVRPTSV